MTIPPSSLLNFFYRGLIPGPSESEEAFLERVKKAVALNHPEWEEVSKQTRSLFGFVVNWIPLCYSNKKMIFWEGGVTWLSKDALPSIQLRKNFKQGNFLYHDRIDLLTHEAVHAVRIGFQEPFFEELLAYRTARQRWRRFWGPLFTFWWEPFLFLVISWFAFFSPLLPIFSFLLWIGWLGLRQITFKRSILRSSLPIVLCLTDLEIIKLAWCSRQSFPKGGTPRERLLSLLALQPRIPS